MAADRRGGFALMFVVVTLAVMAIVATVIVVNSANATSRYNVQLAAAALTDDTRIVGTRRQATGGQAVQRRHFVEHRDPRVLHAPRADQWRRIQHRT